MLRDHQKRQGHVRIYGLHRLQIHGVGDDTEQQQGHIECGDRGELPLVQTHAIEPGYRVHCVFGTKGQ